MSTKDGQRSKMPRIRNLSILGAFTGCLLTTLVYVVFSSTLSLNVQRSVYMPGDEDYAAGRYSGPAAASGGVGVSPGRGRELSAAAQAAAAADDLSDIKLRFVSEQSLGVQKLFRKGTLVVVATSLKNAVSASNLVNTSWGQDTKEWRVAVGSKGGSAREFKSIYPSHSLLASNCEDFSEDEPTPSQLFCLLETVYRLFYGEYRWFFIATKPLYVSVHQLERLLAQMDPDSEVVYMGRSRFESTYCLTDSGVVLSLRALDDIVPQLESCLETNVSYTDTEMGDTALGRCFKSKSQTLCYEQSDFVNTYTEVLSLSQGKKQLARHLNFAAVSPVTTFFNMQVLFVLDQLRELDYQERQANLFSQRLYNSSICKLDFVNATFDPPPPPPPPAGAPTTSTVTDVAADLKSWSVVNPNSTYYSNRLEPREWYEGGLRAELEDLARKALTKLASSADNNSSSSGSSSSSDEYRRVVYGFFRYLGLRGREMVLDVETQAKAVKRVHLFRPHLPRPVLLEDAADSAVNTTINFVVPLSKVNNRFSEFMRNYEELCLSVGESCRLHLVVYGEDDFAAIAANVSVYRRRYPGADLNVIPGKGTFSRGRAIHTGISTLRKSDLVFHCDVDMNIERSFLNRCRRNTLEGRRVYYPEVFKFYDMNYVYGFEPRPKHGYDISRKHGHWCTYGYGMLCIYKSDYDSANGYDRTIEGWGGEDIRLADEVIKHGYEMLRAPDPALSHRYHPRVCSKKLTRSQHSQCVGSRNEDIADRRRLADYIYYLENKCNVKKKIWD